LFFLHGYVKFYCNLLKKLRVHVTPTADEDRGVVAGAQGTTMSSSQQFLEEPNHIGMRGILRPCRYGITWLNEGL